MVEASPISSGRVLRLLILVLLVLVGCGARTRLTSVRDPDFLEKSFSAPAVFVDTDSLEWREQLEAALVQHLSNKGVVALASNKVLPPTRNYAPEERLKVLRASGIDSLILISGETGVERVYIPVTSSTTHTSVTVSGGVYNETSTTQYHGGYDDFRPWASLTTRVVDLATLETAWLAESKTSGGFSGTFKKIRSSYAKAIAQRLVRERVLSPRTEPHDSPSPYPAASSSQTRIERPVGSATVQRPQPLSETKTPSAPPNGAAGFEFGEEQVVSRTKCEYAGHTWAKLETERFTCGGPAKDFGLPVKVALRFCTDRLCEVTLIHRPSQNWYARLLELSNTLTEKYGPPQVHDDSFQYTCQREVRFTQCLLHGAAHLLHKWTWESGLAVGLDASKPTPRLDGEQLPSIRLRFTAPATKSNTLRLDL